MNEYQARRRELARERDRAARRDDPHNRRSMLTSMADLRRRRSRRRGRQQVRRWLGYEGGQ